MLIIILLLFIETFEEIGLSFNILHDVGQFKSFISKSFFINFSESFTGNVDTTDMPYGCCQVSFLIDIVTRSFHPPILQNNVSHWSEIAGCAEDYRIIPPSLNTLNSDTDSLILFISAADNKVVRVLLVYTLYIAIIFCTRCDN
ncbi:hypothetical protein BDC45DRAFT_534914 [Circinella umbellata]|nr:hypothetical protein BDC45DRAFT_534914 [Circinella umbellata]